jgi:3-hydroxyacyl-[acyl-carrier-protein] dehydratase
MESTPAEHLTSEKTLMDVVEIQRILPHRYPFLMIDRVVEVERMKRIVAIKNVTINEPWFHGHFPGHPLMPGVLIIEAMAQAGGVLLLLDVPDRDSKLVVFTGIEDAKFRRPVVPGDTVRFEVTVASWRKRLGKMNGVAYVDDKRVCEATLSCMLVPKREEDKPVE